jgi:hypothetical protein
MLAKRLTSDGAWIAGECNQATNRSKSCLEDATSLPDECDSARRARLPATHTKVDANAAYKAPVPVNRIQRL